MSAQDKNKVLILIADDEVNLLTLLKDNLEERGFEIVTATNGEEALQKSISEKPDIIILDVEMPKLNGLQVCERIRQREDLKRVPIVILSAYAQVEDVRKGMEMGANKYMTKPFKMKDLVESIMALYKAT